MIERLAEADFIRYGEIASNWSYSFSVFFPYQIFCWLEFSNPEILFGIEKEKEVLCGFSEDTKSFFKKKSFGDQ